MKKKDTKEAFLLGRRELIVRSAGMMSLLGFGSVLSRNIAEAATSVVLSPQEEEGPYFVEEKLNRSDIITNADGSLQPGLPLTLAITVSQSVDGTITPLPNAYVDIWQANASGLYSDEAVESTTGNVFLRGYQVTDAHGHVHFLTIYPGWYSGRTVHIHCRVRLYAGTSGANKTDTPTYSFETQFFCDEDITDTVYNSVYPYTSRASQRDTFNNTDRVYNFVDCTTGAVGGSELLTVLNANTSRAVASYSLVLDMSAAAPGSCVGVTDGGINEGTPNGGGGGNGGGGTPPSGTGPGTGGTPPSGPGGTPPSA
jgi:protocatechuate 3,4-dioxygenase beta subunit